MNYVKTLLTICGILILTGCSVDYQLTIDKDFMHEKADFMYPHDEEGKAVIDRLIPNKKSAYYDMDKKETMYYTMETKEDENAYHLIYSYSYQDKKLRESAMASKCFYNREVVNSDNYIILKTSEGLQCLYEDNEQVIDTLTVHIYTDLKVEDSNADKKSGNEYIWVFNKDNYSKKSIYIKVNKVSKEEEKNYTIFLGIVLGVALIFIGIGYLVFKVRFKHRNKI